ncbi:hypothetical protein X474_12365 [Dethiosulfatarculus sandiegensis]|uniref:Uncharacterized protein n=1 Tax=Dethiosulfatarculus sandiegensis TaxID=1429043 RepID=A0A0D2J6Y7_9BACT|nr:hypothetical protein X474_12365 [Dethiosulfatarculus sandiegensis]
MEHPRSELVDRFFGAHPKQVKQRKKQFQE